MGQERGAGLLCERATVTQHRKWDAFFELKDACRETLNFNVTLKKKKRKTDSWSAKHEWTCVLSLQGKLLIKTPQSTVKVTHNNELNNSKQKNKIKTPVALKTKQHNPKEFVVNITRSFDLSVAVKLQIKL